MIYFRALVTDNEVQDTPFIEREVAEPFRYPGGEWHLRNILNNRDTSTVWIADVRGADADDLVQAALLAKVAHQRQAPFVLMLPYLPAARSDRGEPTGAEVYADLVKSMNPQQVIGIDPHSAGIVTYFGRILTTTGDGQWPCGTQTRSAVPGPKLTALDPVPLVERALREANHLARYDGVISPDKGAVDRAQAVAELLGVEIYYGHKDRDFSTGKIRSIEVEPLPHGTCFLVVDDICDGGGTFNGLAEATELPKERLGLWVTHGIFSGKAPTLRQHYEHIYTTDSHPGHGRVGCATMVVPCETYMLENLKKFA